mmetsp:Transcript_67954/g.210190  ORF Transcript_67954/g.210190 Transcript_67954/m.210190 type:complete len:215 (-) Transcript_67954:275-919(-)
MRARRFCRCCFCCWQALSIALLPTLPVALLRSRPEITPLDLIGHGAEAFALEPRVALPLALGGAANPVEVSALSLRAEATFARTRANALIGVVADHLRHAHVPGRGGGYKIEHVDGNRARAGTSNGTASGLRDERASWAVHLRRVGQAPRIHVARSLATVHGPAFLEAWQHGRHETPVRKSAALVSAVAIGRNHLVAGRQGLALEDVTLRAMVR